MSTTVVRACARRLWAVTGLLFAAAVAAGERGSVTAIASVNAQPAAFIGFSSGAVLYCSRMGGCIELEGTSRSVVTAIDTPRAGDDIRAWVGYQDGSVLYCTLTGGCSNQSLQVEYPTFPGG